MNSSMLGKRNGDVIAGPIERFVRRLLRLSRLETIEQLERAEHPWLTRGGDAPL